MYEIKITVEIPGLPEALLALANAMRLQPLSSDDQGKTAAVNKPVEAAKPVEAVAQTAQATSSVPAQTVQPAVEAKSYTLDELSRAGAALIDQGKMPQLLELLKKYGVQAVTQLNPATYPAFVEEMKALGAQL